MGFILSLGIISSFQERLEDGYSHHDPIFVRAYILSLNFSSFLSSTMLVFLLLLSLANKVHRETVLVNSADTYLLISARLNTNKLLEFYSPNLEHRLRGLATIIVISNNNKMDRLFKTEMF